MTIGQLVMYHNLGIELRYGGSSDADQSIDGFAGMNEQERTIAVRAAREAMNVSEAEREALNNEVKDTFRDQYGDV